MLGRFRAKYQQMISPLGKALAKYGFSPNFMTAFSLLMAFFSFYFYSIEWVLWGAFLIMLTGFFDMLDGAIARAIGKTTKFGATLDHVVDRYAEFLILFGIVYGSFTKWFWGVFTLFGMLMASLTRAKAESVGGLESCAVGIAERQEKLLILILGSILNVFYKEALNYAVILVGILSNITVIQRLHYTRLKTEGG